MGYHSLLVLTSVVCFVGAQSSDQPRPQSVPGSETTSVAWEEIPMSGENSTAGDTAAVAPDAGVSSDSTVPPLRGAAEDPGRGNAGSDKEPSAGAVERERAAADPRSAPREPSGDVETKAGAERAGEPGRTKSAPEKAAYTVEIPAGVLFGEFAGRDGPFLIKGSVIVPAGQTLKFGPGCRVFLGGDYPTLTVFGELIVEGEADDPVVFQSASSDPKPWDWDRIYVRSRNRAKFKHCVIRHANYGIAVENGAATIEECIFETNSLNGLVVKNSDVVMRRCTFRRGHVLAILCRAGATVHAESLTVKGNITGIACEDKAYCKLTGGTISNNGNAVAVRKGAAVPIVGTDITRNKIGVVAEQEIPKKSMEMVFGNGVDHKRVTPETMEEILKPPERVESIVLPKSKTPIRTASSFEPGFSALKAPREPTASFIGNVTFGVSYFRPRSTEEEGGRQGLDSTADTVQTYYIGENADDWYDGLQPELTVFAQGKRGVTDINLNMSLRANSWLETPSKVHKEAFTLALNVGEQSLLIGDFYENSSELSISGRELTGFRYTAEAVEMGRGTKRLAFKLAGGESEVAKDTGFHEYDRVEEVDSGFSVRQQLTYLTGVSLKPTHFSEVSVRAIVSRDQTGEPLFRKPISDPGRPDPVAAQMGIIDGSVVLADGKLELSGEIAMGAHDTLHRGIVAEDGTGADSVVQEQHEDYDEVAWYNPQIFTRAIPRVFGLFHPDSNAYAFALGADALLKGFDLGIHYTEIARNFYSAGNPYLESDRRSVTLSGERRFGDHLSGEAEYTYERASVSYKDTSGYSPEDRNELDFEAEYSFGTNRPTLAVEYAARTESSEDYDTDTATGVPVVQKNFEMRNGGALELRQRFDNGIDYKLRYRVIHDNDMTDYYDKAKMDDGDGLRNEVSGGFSFRIRRILRNKTSFKVKYETEKRDDATEFGYKISDNLRLTLIPRKLTLSLKGVYDRRREEEREDDAAVRETTDYTRTDIEGEVKYSFTSRLSATTGLRWERVEDQTPGAVDYRVLIGGLHLTYLF